MRDHEVLRKLVLQIYNPSTRLQVFATLAAELISFDDRENLYVDRTINLDQFYAVFICSSAVRSSLNVRRCLRLVGSWGWFRTTGVPSRFTTG